MLRTLDRPVSASVKRNSSDEDLYIFSRAVSLLKETEDIEKQRPCKLHSLCRIVPDSQQELSAILF